MRLYFSLIILDCDESKSINITSLKIDDNVGRKKPLPPPESKYFFFLNLLFV
jgi:hypothetical protein